MWDALFCNLNFYRITYINFPSNQQTLMGHFYPQDIHIPQFYFSCWTLLCQYWQIWNKDKCYDQLGRNFTTTVVVTVLLLQSCCYGQSCRNVKARVVVNLRPSWLKPLSLFHICQYWHNRVQQEKFKKG